jgi:hypothetical protein
MVMIFPPREPLDMDFLLGEEEWLRRRYYYKSFYYHTAPNHATWCFFFFIIYKILGLRLFDTMHYYYLILFPFSKYLLLSLCLINLELKTKNEFFFKI